MDHRAVRKHRKRLDRRNRQKREEQKKILEQRTITKRVDAQGDITYRYYDPYQRKFVASPLLPEWATDGMSDEQLERLRGPKPGPVIEADWNEIGPGLTAETGGDTL